MQSVKPLVLLKMQVPRWSSLCMKRVLDDEQTVAIPRNHLEDYCTDAETAMLSCQVLSCADQLHGICCFHPMLRIFQVLLSGRSLHTS